MTPEEIQRNKESTRFMKDIIDNWNKQFSKMDETQKRDELYMARQIKSNNVQVDIRNKTIALVKSNEEWRKKQSLETKQQYLAGVKTIENLKMMSANLQLGAQNAFKFATDAKERGSMLRQAFHAVGRATTEKLTNVHEAMKKNREDMVAAIKRSPEMMIGGIVVGIGKAVDGLKEKLADKQDKLLAFFGNKDARDRQEAKMNARKAGDDDRPGALASTKEGVKKAGGWVKKMLGSLMMIGKSGFTSLFKNFFPAIGKFLLKNIGKLGLVGLAIGLVTTFWDDITEFVQGLFSGDSAEGSTVTKDGVKNMLDKMWGFVNDMIKDLFGVDLEKMLADKGINISDITSTISEYLTPMIAGFQTVARVLGKTFKALIKDAFGEEGKPGKLTEVINNVKAIASGMIEGAKNLMGGLFKDDNGKELTFGQVIENMMEKFKGFVNMIMDGARRLTEYFLDPDALVADLKNAFGGLGRMVSNVFSDIMISIKALATSALNPLKSYDEALAELKKEDAKKKQQEADRAEASLSAGLSAMGLDPSVLKGIQEGMDVGTFIRETFGDTDLNETQKGVIENQIRTIVDARERASEQQYEALEAAAEGTVQRMLDDHKKNNLETMLKGDSSFLGKLQDLAGKQEDASTFSTDFGLDNEVMKKTTSDLLSKMSKEEARDFLSKLEMLDKTGDLEGDRATALGKKLGLNLGDDAEEFFKMLMDAEHLKKEGTTMTFADIHGDSIGADVAEALLATGFKQNNDAIVSAVKQIAGMNANLSMLPTILAQLPGAVAQGSANGAKEGRGGVVQQQESSSQSGR